MSIYSFKTRDLKVLSTFIYETYFKRQTSYEYNFIDLLSFVR